MPEFTKTAVQSTPYLYVERSCSMDPSDISATMGTAFKDVWDYMQRTDIRPAGPALSVYYTYDPETMRFRSGFVVAKADLGRAAGEVKGDVTPSGEALSFTHIGSYATLRDDYAKMMEYVEAEGIEIGVPAWEIYVNDPSQTPEDELRTDIFVALA